MTFSQISVELASAMPLDELRKVGRFNLRILAEELGLFEDEAAKAAFMGMSSDDEAVAIFNEMRRVDPLVAEINAAVRETNWRLVCVDLAKVIGSTWRAKE